MKKLFETEFKESDFNANLAKNTNPTLLKIFIGLYSEISANLTKNVERILVLSLYMFPLFNGRFGVALIPIYWRCFE